MGKAWIKLYTDKWLDGTIRDESLETQAIFAGLLSLAGRYSNRTVRSGFIPLGVKEIAGCLRLKSDEMERYPIIIYRLAETKRIQITKNGVFIRKFHNYNPSKWDIWADKNPEQTYTNRHKLSQTKHAIEGELELEGELDIISSSLEDVVKWVKEQEWWSTFKADYPQFRDSDLLSALQWLREKKKRYKLLNRFLINWAKKIPPSKGRVPEVYTKVEDLDK